MDFDGTNQLLFLCSAFFKCLRKTGIKWSNTSYVSYLQISRKPVCDSVTKEFLYNVLTEFGTP